MICQTRRLNSGALSVLLVHCFLISLWKYFTAFAYLLFPYGRQGASEGRRREEEETSRVQRTEPVGTGDNIRCKRAKMILRLETGSVPLTDGFPRVELGLVVSRYMSLVLGSQRVQLVFDDVLTLRHAQEAVSVPWRDTGEQTRRDIHDKGHSDAATARRLRESSRGSNLWSQHQRRHTVKYPG